MKYFDLDDEEKQILADFEENKFKSIPNLAREKRRFQSYLRQTLGKTKNINIRLSSKVLLKLKAKAAAEGLPYQTLLASILHRFAVSSGPYQL